jgi:hypothetical protein
LGVRRLSIRLPKQLLDVGSLKWLTTGSTNATVRIAGENLIVDVFLDEIEVEEYDDADDRDDGNGWLDALAPLRGDILDGDLRLFYLAWLMAVDSGETPDDAMKPMAGLTLTPALEEFARFFCINGDLVEAATEAAAAPPLAEPPRSAVAEAIDRLGEREKSAYLLRLYDGDPHLRAELRRRCRARTPVVEERQARRCAGDLRAAARRRAEERQRAEAEWREAERRKRERAEAKEKERRLDALAERVEAAWREVVALIVQRNDAGYDKATALLGDLRDLSLRQGTDGEFHERLVEIREKHRTKPRLIERLKVAGL